MNLNQQQHAQFLYWQRERESIRIKKEVGEPRPWTADTILQTYRFCNVRREHDKVTRFINQHIRKPYDSWPTLPLMLGIGRWINLPETLVYLQTTYGWPEFNFWNKEEFYCKLRQRKGEGIKIYNPAYVISPCGTRDKERFVTDTLDNLYVNLGHIPTTSLQEAYDFIVKYRGWGAFMTYQVIIDLRHTSFFKNAPDAKTFAAYGPGTRRGFNRLFNIPLQQQISLYNLSEGLKLLRRLNEFELEASDICNCLCEYDKYARAKEGSGTPKQHYRPS